MAKNIKKFFALAMVLAFCMAALTLPAAAAKDADSSQTHIYGEPGSDIPFSKQDIVVTIGDQDYNFSGSGNNSWKNESAVGELNIPDEGDGNSIPVVITDSEGNVYDAQLVNHSDQNGNNGNSKPGTDTYDLIGIVKRGGDVPSGGNEGEDPTGGNEGEEPTGGNEGEEPTGGNEGEEPTGGNEGGEPTGGNEGEEPTGGNEGEEPTGGNEGGDPTGGNEGGNPPYYPYNPASGEIIINDEDVPLASVPKTGDVSVIWMVLSGLSALGLAVTGKKRR